MITAIQELADGMVKAATEQSNRIVSELDASYDATNAAVAAHAERMKAAKAKRAEADAIEDAANRELNTALSQAGAVSLSIIQQITEGRMITGADTPAPKRPRLVKQAAE